MNTKALIAEFLGTMALIIAGTAAIVHGGGSLVTVALAHGLTVVGFAYAFGHLSGTHINPAVTLGALMSGAIDTANAVGYWVAQLLGGIVGAALLAFIVGDISAGNTVGSISGDVMRATVAEAVMTFFFFTVIYQTAIAGKAGNFAGLAIGLTLVMSIVWGGPFTGASLNPARTIGPALISGQMGIIVPGVVGPLVGAALAAVVNQSFLKAD